MTPCKGYRCDKEATTTVFRYAKISDCGGSVSAVGGTIPVCESCRLKIAEQVRRQKIEFGI